MSENNADRVKIIVSQLNASEEQVTPEASFIDDLEQTPSIKWNW